MSTHCHHQQASLKFPESTCHEFVQVSHQILWELQYPCNSSAWPGPHPPCLPLRSALGVIFLPPDSPCVGEVAPFSTSQCRPGHSCSCCHHPLLSQHLLTGLHPQNENSLHSQVMGWTYTQSHPYQQRGAAGRQFYKGREMKTSVSFYLECVFYIIWKWVPVKSPFRGSSLRVSTLLQGLLGSRSALS